MTDPLSVSASISGIVTLAETLFYRTYKYVKAVKKAPKEISALSTEISSLYGILSSLQLVSRQLEGETFDSSTQIHHVHSCYETLEHVKRILDRDNSSLLHDQPIETLKRKLRWPFTSPEVKELIAEIERHKATLGLALNVDCMSGLLQALSRQNEFRDTVEGIRTELKERHEAETRIVIDKERQEILNSFAKVDPRSNHNMSRKLRSPGTGLWLTEGREFKQWLETKNSRLWYYGIPGAGKTVLACSVIEEVLRKSSHSTAVAFFYCDYKNPATQDLSNILSSLACQLSKQDEDSFTKLRKFYQDHNSEHQPNVKYDSEALWDLVKELTLVFDCSMIIIDGLDECGVNAPVVVDSLTALNDIQDTTVKMIFLSRDEIEIRERLDNFAQVSIAARSSDLKLYVASEIEIRTRKKKLRIKDPSLKEHILKKLVEGAEGMFRWVACQMDYLCELPNDAARRTALGALPPDLHSTYDRILSRVHQSNAETRRLVRRSLRWIANYSHPWLEELTVEALCEAISINFGDEKRNPQAIPDEFDILHWCSSLVRKSEDGKRLELAHFTVKEYLQQNDPARNSLVDSYRTDPKNDEVIFAKVCLTYLSFKDFEQGGPFSPEVVERRYHGYPFREYAVWTWEYCVPDHLNDTGLLSLVQRFLSPSKPDTLISWVHDMIFAKIELNELLGWDKLGNAELNAKLEYINSGVAQATPLHYAVMFCPAEVCDWLIASGCDVNRSTRFGTPLHCALIGDYALWGKMDDPYLENMDASLPSVEIVNVLLGAGADPNYSYPVDTEMVSPLSVAVSKRTFNIALQILNQGAILDKTCLDRLERHIENMIPSEIEEMNEFLGHITKNNLRQEDTGRLSKMLLEKQTTFDVTRLMQLDENLLSQSIEYERCLRIAAEYGQVDSIIHSLEVQKLSVHAADEFTGLTALHHAAKTDQLGVAQILVDRGADLSRLDNLGRTALHHALLSGGIHCLQFLLQKTEDTSHRDLEGMTIWHLAAREGNLQALSILLTTHTDLKSAIGLKAGDGRTVLLCAAEGGHVEAMSLLLSAGSDLTETDSDGWTSLHYGAEIGSVEVVEFLAKNAAISNITTHDGSTAIHHAVTCGTKTVDILQILLDNGVDPRKPRNDGCSPLHVIVDTIKDQSIDHSDDDELGQLFCAGRTLLQNILKNSRSESDLRLGSELIYLACSHAFPSAQEIVLALLDYGLDLNFRFAHGKCALMAAAERGNDVILSALLLHGADPCLTDDMGLNAVHCACLNDRENILVRLRETGIDWNSMTTANILGRQNSRVTALHLAAQSKDSSVIEYLLNSQLMSNIDARTSYGETPLFVSVWKRRPRKVSLLLSSSADTTILDEDGDGAIHVAARKGFEDVIAEFIEHRSDLGLPNSFGLTPELEARKHGHVALATTIMEYVNDQRLGSNALPQDQGSRGAHEVSQALKVAIDIGDIELCRRLVQSGIDLGVGIEGCLGCTPLLYSLHREQYAISEYLVSQGSSVKGSTCEIWGTRGYTAIHYAAASGEVELLRMLLERSPSHVFFDHSSIHPIHLAVLQNKADCVKLLLDHASQEKRVDFSDQLSAMPENLTQLVNKQVRADEIPWKWYGEPFPDIFKSARPLHIAISNGNSHIVSMLLAHGASVNAPDSHGSTPLHWAASEGQTAMVEIFLKAGANPNAVDNELRSPALIAASHENVDLIRKLLQAGALIDFRDFCGRTALHLAARSGAKDMLMFVMSKVPEYHLGTEDVWGQSFLHETICEPSAFPMSLVVNLAPPVAAYESQTNSILAAAIENRTETEIRMLLRRIPSSLVSRLLNQRDSLEGTPLYAAAVLEELDVITLLLDAGAQLEAEACDHGTALIGACAIGRLAAVKLLVAKGARTSYEQDGQVYSAFLAAKYHPDVRRWLLVGRFLEGPKLLTY